MHALTTALALLLSCAACAVPQRGEAILRQRGSAARPAGHKLWPCMAQAVAMRGWRATSCGHAWLRLRGAGSDGPECKGAESPRAVHVLTRKMEDVWRTADVLRRRRQQQPARSCASTGSVLVSAPPARSLGDGGAQEPEEGACPDWEATQCMLAELQGHLCDPSALLRHEVCYALGQTGLAQAGQTLMLVLQNASEHAMVRHEAAEGLAALCAHSNAEDNVTQEALCLLQRGISDNCREVAETCQVAAARLSWQPTAASSGTSGEETVPYVSVDPAPPMEGETNTDHLAEVLLDPTRPLFERYRAMFQLRNLGGAASVTALCRAMHDSSALLRHEAAFVLGQLGDGAAEGALAAVLRNPQEQSMVRHEAAEALGVLGEDSCRKILSEFVRDNDPVVAESCLLALDMQQYWSAFKNSKEGL